jgi:WD40 repeat protein
MGSRAAYWSRAEAASPACPSSRRDGHVRSEFHGSQGRRLWCPSSLRGHTGPARVVSAVAAGRLLDGTPVIVSGGYDGTVRVWRLADGALAAPSLELPGSVQSVAVHGKDIVTAARADTAVHQLALP